MPVQNIQPCLLYADDALFFIKPELQQIQILKMFLLTFQSISGLKVNMDKSELLISQSDNNTARQLVSVMRCKEGSFTFTYLGLPLSDKRLNKTVFLPLLRRLNSKLAGWAANFLSLAGRISLTNAVLSSLPVYYMSVFQLPQ